MKTLAETVEQHVVACAEEAGWTKRSEVLNYIKNALNDGDVAAIIDQALLSANKIAEKEIEIILL